MKFFKSQYYHNSRVKVFRNSHLTDHWLPKLYIKNNINNNKIHEIYIFLNETVIKKQKGIYCLK